MKRFVFRNRWLPYALVAPQVAVTLAFFFWPAFDSLRLSLYRIAPAIAGIIWLFIFHPGYGILPWVLSFVTAYQFNWFLKGWVAMTLIVMAAIWKQFGYNLAFYLAGLQAIEASVLEAASVDGAGPIRRFFAVTFPLLSPVTFFLFTLNMTFSFFDTFGLIHSVTQGGPGDATSILVYRAWKDGFEGLQLGFSAAQSVVLMALVILLTAFQFRFAEKRVTY